MRYALLALCGLLCHAQQELAPEVLLLAHIKVKMADNLARLPNYTCTQTIERSTRRAPTRRFELLDTVRLEVALVEGKEMYGWPGAKRIDESDITKLVSGTIGNGDFALMARNLFLTSSAQFKYAGEADLDGRRAARFDYVVPLIASGYGLRVPPLEARVGHHGSIWADPVSFDLLRMQVFADDIPLFLRLSAATENMEYARVNIAGSSFLLPAGSTLTMTQLNGTESRNVARFHACRQFTGESVLSFADPPPDAPLPPAPASMTEAQLPDEVVADIALQAPIDSDSTAVGDVVRAVLKNPIKLDHKVTVPKGAILSGRVARLERAGEFYLLDIRFDSIEFENGHADLRKRENSVSWSPAPHDLRLTARSLGADVAAAEPALAQITIRTTHLKLGRSTPLLLRSRLLKSESNDSIRH
jgi:Arc/MetJ family transcription regulator